MRKLILFILMLSCYSVAYALQIKSVNDNETVKIKISATEQSRIFIANDRISIVRGMEGAYNLKKDDKLGDIYIQPTFYYQHKPFNLFITTEQNRTYHLSVIPVNGASETIELKPLSALHREAIHWESNSPYTQAIINLITAMLNGTNPDGYAIENITSIKPKKFPNCLSMKLLTLYKGAHLRGEIWLVKNVGKRLINLHERQFYQKNALGVAILTENLNPGAETFLYRVVSNDE